jgi:hypothetical protein
VRPILSLRVGCTRVPLNFRTDFVRRGSTSQMACSVGGKDEGGEGSPISRTIKPSETDISKKKESIELLRKFRE